ncbi:LAME_0H06898g1_1 [Lachancea meyersii CBS 8951]|uniref:Elongator complex protein 4 n=1 Tax=Lachancea meyersii CBS 8951 TaxID=1266667 RepID=A0A1G4KF54_9SACH|nr:LAME_0H06898g1_1 [Lachancea meyersii CBS 8951]
MSFRKRGDVLGAPGARRLPVGGQIPGRSLGPQRTPVTSNDAQLADRVGKLSMRDVSNSKTTGQIDSAHPGIRPSPATSQPSTATGCQDLDKLLGHMGLPLGQTLLVQEQSATDFASVLVKNFAAQGIVHNRKGGPSSLAAGNTHLVVLTMNPFFAKELPGVYQGSKKEAKRFKVSSAESEVTVQNMLESGAAVSKPSAAPGKDLKIAWRYGLKDNLQKGALARNGDVELETYPEYSHTFDITSRLVPAPTSAEITLISPVQPLSAVLTQLQAVFQKHQKKLIRILLPQFLHPVMYPPKYSKLAELLPLLHGIRSVVKQNAGRAVLLASISSDLYAHNGNQVLTMIENLFDSVIDLEPFPQEMSQFLERVYKSQPNKIQHGLVHVLKLPLLSDRGEMHVQRSEYAFKNGRKKFEIEAWGIPVDDSEVQDSKNMAEKPTEDHNHTKVALEF